MPRLSLYKPEKGNDFAFQDRNISEAFQVGGTDAYIHKYMGPVDQGGDDKTKADALVNPNRLDEKSVLKYLCATGVTFLLLVAVNRKLRTSEFKAPDILSFQHRTGRERPRRWFLGAHVARMDFLFTRHRPASRTMVG